jgi:hypothetical protein
VLVPVILNHLRGVMAGLVPAIRVLLAAPPYPPPQAGEGREGETWMPATIPGSSPGTGMTLERCFDIVGTRCSAVTLTVHSIWCHALRTMSVVRTSRRAPIVLWKGSDRLAA